ncbi:unnamed protein product [Rodentolepis nana]|uniref:Uncharacterized protein n=1 Tax=Rodentolepis nana TaxID=102285 RepID=A0A0R3TP22_RODNA|nr:unnamed protein product [Rodentolepis nana]
MNTLYLGFFYNSITALHPSLPIPIIFRDRYHDARYHLCLRRCLPLRLCTVGQRPHPTFVIQMEDFSGYFVIAERISAGACVSRSSPVWCPFYYCLVRSSGAYILQQAPKSLQGKSKKRCQMMMAFGRETGTADLFHSSPHTCHYQASEDVLQPKGDM